MAAVKYTSKRNLRAGHAVDTEFEFTLKLRDLTLSRTPDTDVAKSLGGNRETLRHKTETKYNCTTIPLLGTDIEDMEEFLSSTEGGEGFDFDPVGAAGDSPDQMRPMYLDTNGYSKTRAVKKGDGGLSDFFRFTWRMVER